MGSPGDRAGSCSLILGYEEPRSKDRGSRGLLAAWLAEGDVQVVRGVRAAPRFEPTLTLDADEVACSGSRNDLPGAFGGSAALRTKVW